MTNELRAARPDPFEHVAYLDGWRGIAITLLLIGHFLPVPGLNLGAVGVNFFFVLSGWLMTRILFVQETPIPVFYRRRIARILPAHLAFVALVCLWFAIDGRPINHAETAAAALFVINYVGIIAGHTQMPFGHIWSLAVEEHSYILLASLAMLARRKLVPARVLLGTAAALCAAFAAVYVVIYPDREQLMFRQWLHTEVAAWGIFCSGFLFLALQGRRLPRLPGLTVPLLALAAVALHWWSVPLFVERILGVGAMALAINLLPAAPMWLRQALSFKPLRLLGLWSFSLYLWQQPFYQANGVPPYIALAGAFAAGLCSYYLLERPARRLINRHFDRSTRDSVVAQ
jgi:peptidoglycan/LPS O-acetylase OafA/YrhL